MNPVNLNFPCPESICGFPVPTHMVYHLCILSRKTIQTMTTTNTSFSCLFLPFPLSYALSQILFFLITSSLIHLFYVRLQPLPLQNAQTHHSASKYPIQVSGFHSNSTFIKHLFLFFLLCLKDIFNNC